MRRIGEFQLNSPKLEQVYGEVVEARGNYSTLGQRLDDIKNSITDVGSSILRDYKIISAVYGEGRIVVTINPGLAFVNETPVLMRNAAEVDIQAPMQGVWYYVYLSENGQFFYFDSLVNEADKLLLGRVVLLADGSVSIEDMRPFLQKGGVTKEIYEARGPYQKLGDRLDVIETMSAGYTFSEVYISSDGQQEFTLQHKYPIGKNKLKVFAGGLLMTPGSDADYIEAAEDKVIFNYPLSEGIVVRFVVENIAPGMGFSEIHTAQEGQSEFKLSYPFPVGSNRLRVFVNGVLYTPGSDNDYVEVDEYTVRFNDPLSGGEVVQFICDGVDPGNVLAAGGFASLAYRLNSQLGDCNVDISIEYDENGRPIKEIWVGDVNKTIEYTYNERGYREMITETDGSVRITTVYTYNEQGLITGISVRKQVV